MRTTVITTIKSSSSSSSSSSKSIVAFKWEDLKQEVDRLLKIEMASCRNTSSPLTLDACFSLISLFAQRSREALTEMLRSI